MDFREHTRQVWESLADHPRRVVASAMGVFWGAAAIVFLMAFGAGFRTYMFDEFSRFGEGIVFVFPAATSSGFPGYRKGVPVRLSRDDARAVEREQPEAITAALPEHQSSMRALVEGGGRMRRLDLHAVDHRYGHFRNFEMGWGRFISARDVERRRAVAVIGYDSAEALFGSAAAALGSRVRVDGRSFEVIGVPKRKGTQYMNTNRPDDKLLLVPITSAEARLGYDEKQIDRILLIPTPGTSAEDAVRAALETLGPRAGFHPDDKDAVKWFDSMSIVQLTELLSAGFMVFIGVAGTVTLLIGGVGIANFHLATLAERTVEIAVCKALGARNRSLVVQTVLESLAVSGGASLLGVGLGALACAALALAIPAGSFPVPATSIVVVGVTLFAVLGVALLAAAIPASRVRSMEISAALRAS